MHRHSSSLCGGHVSLRGTNHCNLAGATMPWTQPTVQVQLRSMLMSHVAQPCTAAPLSCGNQPQIEEPPLPNDSPSSASSSSASGHPNPHVPMLLMNRTLEEHWRAHGVTWERSIRHFLNAVMRGRGAELPLETAQRISSLYQLGGTPRQLRSWTRLFHSESVPLCSTQLAALARHRLWPEMTRSIQLMSAPWEPRLGELAVAHAARAHQWHTALHMLSHFPTMAIADDLPLRNRNFRSGGISVEDNKGRSSMVKLAESAEYRRRSRRHTTLQPAASVGVATAVLQSLYHTRIAGDKDAATSSSWEVCLAFTSRISKVVSPSCAAALFHVGCASLAVGGAWREVSARVRRCEEPTGFMLRWLLRSALAMQPPQPDAVLDALQLLVEGWRDDELTSFLVSASIVAVSSHSPHMSDNKEAFRQRVQRLRVLLASRRGMDVWRLASPAAQQTLTNALLVTELLPSLPGYANHQGRRRAEDQRSVDRLVAGSVAEDALPLLSPPLVSAMVVEEQVSTFLASNQWVAALNVISQATAAQGTTRCARDAETKFLLSALRQARSWRDALAVFES